MKRIFFVFTLFIGVLFFLSLMGTVNADCCPRATVCDGYCSSGVCWKSKTSWSLGKCLLEKGDPCGAGSAYGIYSCGWGTKCDNPLGSGKCRSAGSVGTSCANDSSCNSGLFCDWQFRCKNRLSEGSICSDDKDCKSGLVCLDLSCQKPGDSTDRCFGIGQGSCGSGLVCDFYGECRHDPPLTGEICDKSNPIVPVCAKDLFCNILRCKERKKAGERCFASGDCVSGLECRLCLSKNCDYSSQCFPQPSNKIIDKEDCLAMYSSTTHKVAKKNGVAMNFGAGSAATIGAGATDEVGTVYGPDGSYGCYLSYCTGGELSVGISDSATVGLYNSYEAFLSGASNTVQSAGIGEFVSVSTSQVFNSDGKLVGTQDSFGFGVGLSPPLSAGYYTCNTIVRTVIEPNNDNASESTPSSQIPPPGIVSSDPPRDLSPDTDANSEHSTELDSNQDSNEENNLVSNPSEPATTEKNVISIFIEWLMGLFQ